MLIQAKKNIEENMSGIDCVRVDGTRLLDLAAEERADPEIVLAAVQQNGHVLDVVHPRFRGDKRIVLAAVQDCGGAIQYASAKLRADKEVVLTAARTFDAALYGAADELFDDCDFVAKASVINAHMMSELQTLRRKRGPIPNDDRLAWILRLAPQDSLAAAASATARQKRRQEQVSTVKRKRHRANYHLLGELLSDEEAESQREMEMARDAYDEEGSAEEEAAAEVGHEAQAVAEVQVKDDGEQGPELDAEQAKEYEELWNTYMQPRKVKRAPVWAGHGARTLRPEAGKSLPSLLCELPPQPRGGPSILGQKAYEALKVLESRGRRATALAKLRETYQWQLRQGSKPARNDPMQGDAPAFLRRRQQPGEVVEVKSIDLVSDDEGDEDDRVSYAIDLDSFPFRDDAEFEVVPKMEA